MPKPTTLMIAALIVNVLILAPVVSGLLFQFPYNPQALGPVTDGLRVLTAIYSSIMLVSGLLIWMHLRRFAWAVPMTVAMFAVQITYKAQTVPLIGLDNPVVLANVFVIVVQVLVLLHYWNTVRRDQSVVQI